MCVTVLTVADGDHGDDDDDGKSTCDPYLFIVSTVSRCVGSFEKSSHKMRFEPFATPPSGPGRRSYNLDSD